MNRKSARENAFILLFESVCKNDETPEEILNKAMDVRSLEVDEYVKNVFFGVHTNLRQIDECIDKCLKGWKKERLSVTSIALCRLSVYELMFMNDIPARVSINEAIELSKKYDDEKAYTFVNGVLNCAAELLERK